jgi:hypothetical protein
MAFGVFAVEKRKLSSERKALDALGFDWIRHKRRIAPLAAE